MKPVVLFSTKGGNTEKVAREIASELGCPCVKISKKFDSSALDLNDYDLVFAGTGIYVSKPNVDLLNYLKEADLKGSKKFALFMTWFGAGKSDKSPLDKLKEVLHDKGQTVLDNCYACYGEGHSFIMRGLSGRLGHEVQGHPDTADLDAARKWAKDTAE